jgi:putative alpha-1,2-mannosidase
LPFGKFFPQYIETSVARLTILGMAKAVADTSGENQAGFAYDTKVVTGFSHMHDSGTGGVSFI